MKGEKVQDCMKTTGESSGSMRGCSKRKFVRGRYLELHVLHRKKVFKRLKTVDRCWIKMNKIRFVAYNE